MSSSNWIPNRLEIPSSYRAELGGILGALQLLTAVHSVFPIQVPLITLHCDNESTVTTVNQVLSSRAIDLSLGSSDLLQAIQLIQPSIPVTVHIHWIKGHQLVLPSSPVEVRLNHLCDRLAKDRWHRIDPDREVPQFSRGWRVSCGTTPLSKLSGDALYTWAIEQHPELSASRYWRKKSKLSSCQWDLCDHESFRCAMSSLPHNKRRWLVKFLSGWCATGHRSQLRGKQVHSTCPRCGHLDETTAHLLICKGQGADIQWELSMTALDTWLGSVDTRPSLRQSLMTGLRSWYSGNSPLGPQDTSVEHQCTIGWDQLLHVLRA